MSNQNSSQQVIFTKANNGRFTFITPNVSSLLGLSASDILNKTELDLFGSEWGFESFAVDQKVQLTGESIHFDTEILVHDQPRRLRFVKHPQMAEDGSHAGIIGTIQEIVDADTKQVEPTPPIKPEAAQINTSEAEVLALYRGLLTLQSAASAMSVSLEPEQILETYTWELAHLLNADGCVVMRWHESENCLATIAAYQHERWQNELSLNDIRFDLAEHVSLQRLLQERSVSQLFQGTAHHLFDEYDYLAAFDIQGLLMLPLVFQGRRVGLVLLLNGEAERPFTDLEISLAQLLTDQVAGFIINAWLFAELAEMNESLRVSNAELDAFSHTVAHDLKSPLANTMGFATILIQEKEALSAQEAEEFLTIILNNGKRMRGIIDGLLLLASVRKEDVKISPVDMEGVISEVFARLYYTIMDANAQIAVETEWENGLGYTPWLEEVWANYIGNAIKYGGKSPQIGLGSEVQPDGMVRYWVRDHGDGLTEAQQAQLFMPFVRLGLTDNRGHGLGLSIVQRIVTRLGGKVGVHSQPGVGSVFFFTLPAAT
ncbi:MAG: GAF domain-containing protein [Anaerolineae bacterium]|nr:GAF domain-containing protein [Anaerolineae bacterium]